VEPLEYEQFVTRVCQELLSCQGVQVYRQKEFVGRRSGRKIRVDACFEMGVLGTRVLFVLECKCHNRRLCAGDVEEFCSKLQDIGAHKGIMFTTVGYQAGAQQAARGCGIGLAELSPDARHRGARIVVKHLNRQRERAAADVFLTGCIVPGWELASHRSPPETSFDSGEQMLRAIAHSLFDQVPWGDVFKGGDAPGPSPASYTPEDQDP